MNGTQQTLRVAVAGRVLSFPERERWDRYKHGFRTLAVWLLTLLVVIFGYDTVMQAFASGEWQYLLVVPIALVGMVMSVVFAVGERKRRRRDLQTQWYNEQADKPRLLAGVLVELYEDRAVRTDLRSTAVLFYRELTAVTETADGFLLQAGNRELVIRSADLTDGQAALVRECLRQAASGVYQYKKTATGRLEQPLPIPVFHSTDAVLSRGSITLSRGVPAERVRRERMRMVLGWVVPMTAVLGHTLACWITVTAVFAVDLLLLTGTSMAVGVLLTVFGSLFGKNRTVVQLAITREGVGGFANGVSEFVVWSRVKASTNNRGLYLFFPDDVPLCIPWRCLEHPEAVQQLFHTQFR